MRNSEPLNLPHVFVLGAPGPVGGADTELWHTLRLWRRNGLPVTVIPTWHIHEQWRDKCEAIGCNVQGVDDPAALCDVPGIRGAVVVSFCNRHFLSNAALLRQLGCSTIWVNCMTWVFEAEHEHYREHGLFTHYVFQSEYQRRCLMPDLQKYGYRPEQGSLIRGAFCVDDFPYRPLAHVDGTPFVVGRISRPDVDKYAWNTWEIYRSIAVPKRARVMAWNRIIEKAIGSPPEWAECLHSHAETPQEFLGKLHCMLQVNGRARENWPRSGLEAMASGVPIVAQNRWGWCEMVRHGETGFLADTPSKLAHYATALARDEDLRLKMVQTARQRLEQTLAPPERIWQSWQTVLRSCCVN